MMTVSALARGTVVVGKLDTIYSPTRISKAWAYDKQQRIEVGLGENIMAGDRVASQPGQSLGIALIDKSEIVLDQSAELTFGEKLDNAGHILELYLAHGSMYLHVQSVYNYGDLLALEVPKAFFGFVSGDFYIEQDPSGSATLRSFRGVGRVAASADKLLRDNAYTMVDQSYQYTARQLGAPIIFKISDAIKKLNVTNPLLARHAEKIRQERFPLPYEPGSGAGSAAVKTPFPTSNGAPRQLLH
ncbi:MAG: hypothetical protein HY074_06520 [Deltaproteobacteria bacterium]|nr:hypothetical protein [Deltaproteobacteria bacterium]